MPIINNHPRNPGKSKFWEKTHPLSDRLDELHTRLVPVDGPASNLDSELVRALNNLFYEIFNNGFCNDKTEELALLTGSKTVWIRFLENPESIKFLETLVNVVSHQEEYDDWDEWERDSFEEEARWDEFAEPRVTEPDGIDMTQEVCDQIDDICQAVTQYVGQSQRIVNEVMGR